MVGHLLLYHPAVNRLKMLIEEGALGDVVYAQSDRLNVNYFKNDRSVMWDLAPHDVSMVDYVTGKTPKRVISAVGCSSDKDDIMDITHLTLEYEDGMVAQISDSWITPKKHVVLLVRGTKATAILDDTLPEHKLQIFDNKSGEMSIWNIDKLCIKIDQLRDMNADLDLTGFTEKEISDIFDEQAAQQPDEIQEQMDSVPATPEKPQTKSGDVWTIGRHKLHCYHKLIYQYNLHLANHIHLYMT